MKEKYKNLMKQYGGSVPFSVLSDTKKKLTKKRSRSNRGGSRHNRNRSRHNKKRSRLTKRVKRKLSTKGYIPGTIIRQKDGLYKFSSSRKWFKI
jgi:hypothetical protein